MKKVLSIIIFLFLSFPIYAQSDLDNYIKDLPPDLPENVRNSMIEQERKNLLTNPIDDSSLSIRGVAIMVLIGSGSLLGGLLISRNKAAQKPIKFDPKKYGLDEDSPLV